MSFQEVHPTHPMSSQKGIPEEVTIPKRRKRRQLGRQKGRLSRHKECVCKGMAATEALARFWEAEVSQHWRSSKLTTSLEKYTRWLEHRVQFLNTLNRKVLSVSKVNQNMVLVSFEYSISLKKELIPTCISEDGLDTISSREPSPVT